MIARRPFLIPLAVVLLAAAPSRAQAPGDDPHPKMPWNYYHGQVLQYIQVPPQRVTIEVQVPGAEGEEPRMQQQVVEIPGYTVTETTTGYVVPAHYTLEQVGPGQYQWRLVPAQFRPK